MCTVVIHTALRRFEAAAQQGIDDTRGRQEQEDTKGHLGTVSGTDSGPHQGTHSSDAELAGPVAVPKDCAGLTCEKRFQDDVSWGDFSDKLYLSEACHAQLAMSRFRSIVARHF